MGAADRWDRGIRATPAQLFLRPAMHFLWLYLARGGFLDGAVGLQTSMLQAFFVTFVKQGRLWELEHGRTVADAPAADVLPMTAAGRNTAWEASRAA